MMSLQQKIKLKELQLNANKTAINIQLHEVSDKINKKLTSPSTLFIAGVVGFWFGYTHFNVIDKNKPSESLISMLTNGVSLGLMSISFYEKFKNLD